MHYYVEIGLIQFYYLYYLFISFSCIMGNSFTIDSNTNLDEYAGDFILHLSPSNLKKLNDAKECNKLIIFIADSIEKTTPQIEIKRVLDKHITQRSDNVSIDIAKFYVKVAHVYASIVKTINPLRKGDKKTPDVTSLCRSRLFSLINGSDVSDDGIPELDMLYNDSKYDVNTGKFNGRSSQMDEVYKKNLETFYMAFTGSSVMDYNVKKFSDIKIGSYSKEDYPYPLCEDGDCSDEALFEQYAVNIANNLKHLNKSQTKLNDVLETLFTKDGGINQSLSDVELSSIIAKTRDTVINLYLSCEEHYGRGVAIYEAISNKKILKTLLNQQKELVKHRIRLSVGF
jgi:hypothetical protein